MKHLNLIIVIIMVLSFAGGFLAHPQQVYATTQNLTVNSTKDTYLYNGEDWGHGNLTLLAIDCTVAVRFRCLLTFNISSIPAGSTVQAAYLSWYFYNIPIGSPVGRTYNCYRLLRQDWVENEADASHYKDTTAWTTTLCGSSVSDYTTTNGVSTTVPALNNWMTWNVTSQVNWAHTNSTTADFRISDSVETEATRNMTLFYSNNYTTDLTLRPRLTVLYEPPVPTVTVTTDAITGFGHTWAIGKGTISGGNATQIGIDYGTTSALGSSKTEVTPLASGQSFVVRFDGLTPATKYYWRAKAYSGSWVYGSNMTFYTSGSDTEYEYFDTGDDANVTIYGGNWFGQTFTTNATVPHTVTKIIARLFRGGSPGTLTAHLYRTSSSLPTGEELSSGDIDGDTLTTNTSGAWYTIALDEEVTLDTSTIYSIVLEAKDGSSTNNVTWRYDSGNGYAGGTEVTSTNGGTSWSTVSANDMMFQIWGNPALRVLECKVFESLIEDGDQLFIFSYQVLPLEDYSDKLSINYYNTQLLLSSTLKAQGKLPAWGYKPTGFYLDADNAITWGENLTTIRITGVTGSTFAGDTADYILTGADWIGEDLNILDDWVISTASAMGTWYGETFTGTNDAGEDMLTPDGGLLFIVGIPGIEDIRPGLFSITPVTPIPGKKTEDTSYMDSLLGGFGETWTNATEDIGELLGVSGGFVGGSMWAYVVVLGISVIGVGVGSPIIALIAAGLPLMFVGGGLGTIPLPYILIPIFLLGVVAILKMTKFM